MPQGLHTSDTTHGKRDYSLGLSSSTLVELKSAAGQVRDLRWTDTAGGSGDIISPPIDHDAVALIVSA